MNAGNFINSYQPLFVIIGITCGICTAVSIWFALQSQDKQHPMRDRRRVLSALLALPCWFVLFVIINLVSIDLRILLAEYAGLSPLHGSVLLAAIASAIQFQLLLLAGR